MFWCDRLAAAGAGSYAHTIVSPVSHHSWYGRNRHNPGWQDRFANERPNDSGLAALRLTDAGDIKAALRNPFMQLRGFFRNPVGSKLRSNIRESTQRFRCITVFANGISRSVVARIDLE